MSGVQETSGVDPRWAPPAATLHDWVESVAAAHAGRPAYLSDSGATTFEEFTRLWARTTRLLAAEGVKAGQRVGLSGDSSPSYVASMLAVMGAGAIAVPFSPGLPELYRATLAERASLALLLEEGAPTRYPASADSGTEPDLTPPGIDTPFLLMFTSGSTGAPKGVLHAHRQPVNRISWMLKEYPIGPDEVCAARPGVSVMPSLWELFGGLCSGVPTLLLPSESMSDPKKWVDSLTRHAVTRITVTPAQLRILLTELRRRPIDDRPPLRVLTVGGETLSDRLVTQHEETLPECLLLEDYGATETNTVGVGIRRGGQGRPVFEPIGGVQVALDAATEDVSCSLSEGELCVAGAGVALQYWGDPSLTQARIGPYGGFPRAYRTGDRARLLPDGQFELLGRQRVLVKVNGLSVDIEAIERALREVPGVIHAAAFARRPEGSDWSQLCAAIVTDGTCSMEQAKGDLSRALPPHMVPSRISLVDALPQLPTGKLDRAALERVVNVTPLQDLPPVGGELAAIAEAYASVTKESLGITEVDETWATLGLNSLSTVAIAQAITEISGVEVTATELFSHVTPRRLAEYLAAEAQRASPDAELAASGGQGSSASVGRVVVTGMAAIAPGASTLDEFWSLIRQGGVATTRIPTERWPGIDENDDALRGHYIDDVMSLDPGVHGLSLTELNRADPQLRVTLRAVRQCLQDAGVSRRTLAGQKVGVFVGCRPSGYINLRRGVAESREPEAFLGGDEAMIASRVAHSLDLHGAAITVNTTCSSGLVAAHLARQAILAGECEMALVMAASVTCDPEFLRKTARLGVTSSSGSCRPFDARADGFVPSEGAGCILLESDESAVASRRTPWVELLGSGLNHDGLSSSITAPNGDAQTRLLESVYQDLPGAMERIGFIETHGTGTALGDPVESDALCRVWPPVSHRVAIGSLKGNIGHANAAAGLLGLIKTALSLHYRVIPPLAGFQTPNPHLPRRAGHLFTFPLEESEWPAELPCAAVSAFGMSGTNAHVVMQAGVDQSPPTTGQHVDTIVPLSAPDMDSLRCFAGELANALSARRDPSLSLDRVAATLGRRAQESTAIELASATVEDLIAQLRSVASGENTLVGEVHGTEAPAGAWTVHLPVSRETVNQPLSQEMTPETGSELCAAGTVEDSHQSRDGGVQGTLARFLDVADWADVVETPLRDLGLDSLRALSVRDALASEWGLSVSEYELLEGATLSALQSACPPGELSSEAPHSEPASTSLEDGPGPPTSELTELQSVYLTARLAGRTPAERIGAWNALVLAPDHPLDTERLQSAWEAVHARHDMLRVGTTPQGKQVVAAESASPRVSVTEGGAETPDAVVTRLLHNAAAQRTHSGAVLHLIRDTSGDRIVLGVDSFVADARSTQILLEDLWAHYAGQELPPGPTPRSFFKAIQARASTRTEVLVAEALEYWGSRTEGLWSATATDLTKQGQAPPAGDQIRWKRLSRALSASEVRRIEAAGEALDTPILTLLLARFDEWLGGYLEQPSYIGLTVTERPPGVAGIDRTVGPFTEMMLHPVSPRGQAHEVRVADELREDLAHRAVTGTAVLRSLGLAPPRIMFSGITRTSDRSPVRVESALSVTSGVHLHAHVTRGNQGSIQLDWDVDLDNLPEEDARRLFSECYKALTGVSDHPPTLGGIATAPLTRGMRSYQVAQVTNRPSIASHATRVYEVGESVLSDLGRRWRERLAGEKSLVSLPTPNGQVCCSSATMVAPIQNRRLEPGATVEEWATGAQAEGARTLTQHRWPAAVVAAGSDGRRHLVAVTHRCEALDAPSTLLLPRLLLAEEDEGLGRESLAYSQWQDDRASSDASKQYWSARVEELSTAVPQALAVPQSDVRRMLRASFAWPSGKSRQELTAILALHYQQCLKGISGISPLPVMTVGYADRGESPRWERALGDFSTFGFLTSEDCRDADSVRMALQRDSDHRSADWFPLLAKIVPPGKTIFPAVFTDCLSQGVDSAVEGATLKWASSHTSGVVIDCLVYEAEGRIDVEWSADNQIVSDESLERAHASFTERVEREFGESAPHSDALAFQEAHNRTDCPYDTTATITSLFDSAASIHANRVALLDDEGEWSYAEVSRHTERIASRLRYVYGVGRGDVVAVQMDRRRSLVPTLLAILRLGAAFVPLSAADPQERRNRAILRAGARLLITSEPAPGSAVPWVQEGELVSAVDGGLPPTDDESTPDGLAYIIFTSGSSGDPKGVAVRHRPVINLFEDLQKRYQFGPEDRGIWVNSMGFDLSIFDIFGLLSFGSSVRVVNETDRLSPNRIAEIITTESVTFWNSAPVYFQTVFRQLLTPRFIGKSGLRLAFLSGDWIPLTLARECLERMPDMKTVALGGATEAVVWSNLHEIEAVPEGWRSVPYGRPIQNARYYILDESLEPVGIGSEGELYIGGECLADGYAGDERLTAERFVSDPFVAGGRMYRTGDLARFFPDGEIEFLGRCDRQVKIRGHRIELGEVEHAMERAGYVSPVVLATEGGESNVGTRALIAFCLGGDNESAAQALADEIPHYMAPSTVVRLESYPITKNGKRDDKALLSLAMMQSAPRSEDTDSADGADDLADAVLSLVAETLGVSVADLDVDLGLGHQGFNSLHFALLADRLGTLVGGDVLASEVLPLTSLRAVVDFVEERARAQSPAGVTQTPETEGGEPPSNDGEKESAHHVQAEQRPVVPSPTSEDIAVIGMYCRFPGAEDYQSFWRNIAGAVDCVSEVPEDRWDWRAVYGDRPDRYETTAKWGGFLSHIDRFDCSRFSISPREAGAMDVRQRLVLTGAWQLMENAGHAPLTPEPRPIGLFLGATGDEYGSRLESAGAVPDKLTLVGTGRSFIANRVNYALNWSGPSEVIDTTCSSSLVAIHQAVTSLRSGDCAMAVAGGVSVLMDSSPHIALSKIGVLATDGRCKTFDERADGYVRSEGIGLVLLKPLADAIADGDHIRAVIKATAINHGGRSSALTAPNSAAQQSLLERALTDAGPGIAGLGLHEAHGTGTRLGDPIEVAAYRAALGAAMEEEGVNALPEPVSLGSVKTCIGHAEAAAGVAGFLKAILALEKRIIPPLVHYRERNPQVAGPDSLTTFDTAVRPWRAPRVDGESVRRRATVSAFGFGGVNACAVLEESPPHLPRPETTQPELFVVSGRTAEETEEYAKLLAQWLRGEGADVPLRDVSRTLRTGRVQHQYRVALVAAERYSLARELTEARAQAADSAKGVPELSEALRRRDLVAVAQAWLRGGQADWAALDERTSELGRRTELPFTPMDCAVHWHESIPRTQSSQQTTWRCPEGQWGSWRLRVTEKDAFLADHVVAGQRIIPGAAWLAAAIDLCSSPWGLRLRNVSFESLCTLGDAPCTDVTARLDEATLRFSPADEDASRHYCSARVEAGQPNAERGLSLLDQARRYSQHVDGAACDKLLAARGVTYGPSYQAILEGWHSPDELLLHVRLPQWDSSLSGTPIPLLDSLFQGIVLLEALNGQGTPSVPVHVQRVDVFQAPGGEAYVVTRRSAQAGDRYDAHLYNPEGSLCVSLWGVLGRPVHNGEAGLNGVPADGQRAVVPMAPLWVPAGPLPTSMETHPSIVVGAAQVADPVRGQVRDTPATGLTVHVYPEADSQRVLVDCAAALRRACASSTQGLRSVVFVVPTSHSDANVLAAGLAGLEATLRLELPEVAVSVLLQRRVDTATIAALHDSGSRGLFRSADSGLERESIVPLSVGTGHAAPSVLVPRDGFALVSGGAGGVGSALCEHLSGLGVPVLALGRRDTPGRPLPPGTEYQSIDVSDGRGLLAVLDEARPRLGRVGAVYHCAGLQPRGLFLRSQTQDTEDQLGAKLSGAINLDEATAQDSPDLFVGFSSLTAHAGVVGCANYGMANRAMEGFIASRSSTRPGRSLCIAWSAWALGMQLPDTAAARVRAEGIHPIPPQKAWEWLASSTGSTRAPVLISPYGDARAIMASFGT